MVDRSPNEMQDPGSAANDEFIAPPQTKPPRLDRRGILIVSAALVAFLIVLVAIVLIWRWRNSSEPAEANNVVVSVKVAKAEKSEIATEVSAVGTIWPREKADVAAKVGAQIKRMALLKNKFVKAGEVIALLESRDLQAQRAEALAALNEARASERSVVTGTIPQTNAQDQKALRDAQAKVNNARATYERRRVLY